MTCTDEWPADSSTRLIARCGAGGELSESAGLSPEFDFEGKEDASELAKNESKQERWNLRGRGVFGFAAAGVGANREAPCRLVGKLNTNLKR